MADVLHETSEAERADGVHDPVHDQHVPDVPDAERTRHVCLGERNRNEMFYNTMNVTHSDYGYDSERRVMRVQIKYNFII